MTDEEFSTCLAAARLSKHFVTASNDPKHRFIKTTYSIQHIADQDRFDMMMRELAQRGSEEAQYFLDSEEPVSGREQYEALKRKREEDRRLARERTGTRPRKSDKKIAELLDSVAKPNEEVPIGLVATPEECPSPNGDFRFVAKTGLNPDAAHHRSRFFPLEF